MSLKYESSSEQLNISATQLFLNPKPQRLDQDLHFAVAGAMRNVLESHKGGVVTPNSEP